MVYSLFAAVGDGDKDGPLILSTPQGGENNVSTATIERYKSQVEKLQDEITNVRSWKT